MTRCIEITFPVDVELPKGWERKLDRLVAEVCQAYEAGHPDQVMWPFGSGQKMTTNPFMVDDDHPLEFDEGIYTVEIACRERYETESYVRGDFEWQGIILNTVGWGPVTRLGLNEWPGQWYRKEKA